MFCNLITNAKKEHFIGSAAAIPNQRQTKSIFTYRTKESQLPSEFTPIPPPLLNEKQLAPLTFCNLVPLRSDQYVC